MSKILSDSFFFYTASGTTLYQLIRQASQIVASHPSCPQHIPLSSPHVWPYPMNLNLVPKQLPSIILAATANSSPASHFSPLKKKAFFPPRSDGIASLACPGNDFSAGSWPRCFPQVKSREWMHACVSLYVWFYRIICTQCMCVCVWVDCAVGCCWCFSPVNLLAEMFPHWEDTHLWYLLMSCFSHCQRF